MAAPRLVCPRCGWTGLSPGAHAEGFRYLEEVTSIRWVKGVDANGTVHVEAEERIAIEDPGYRPRFQCGECLAEFPIPRRLTLDFQ